MAPSHRRRAAPLQPPPAARGRRVPARSVGQWKSSRTLLLPREIAADRTDEGGQVAGNAYGRRGIDSSTADEQRTLLARWTRPAVKPLPAPVNSSRRTYAAKRNRYSAGPRNSLVSRRGEQRRGGGPARHATLEGVALERHSVR